MSIDAVRALQVNGTYYDSRLISKTMLEDYTYHVIMNASTFLNDFYYGKTYAAIIMHEQSGNVAYFFFFVRPPTSRWCNSTYNCVVGTIFEAKYDVSDISFPQYHCFYGDQDQCPTDYTYYHYRRRLLSSRLSGTGLEGKPAVTHVQNPARSRSRMRRLLQTSTLTSATKPSSSQLVKCYWVNNCGTKPKTSTCYYQVCK